MDEEIVGLVVRLVCGGPSEPALYGLVEVEGSRFRIWKHAGRMRVETEHGVLRAVHDGHRVLTFDEGEDAPNVRDPRDVAYADEDAPWSFVLRPSLQDIDLDERRLDAAVTPGERFGRATASFTLAHQYHREFGLALVLDAATGMPFEVVEAGRPVVRWIELDVVDAIDDELFTWTGEVARSGRPGPEVTDDDLDEDLPAQERHAVRRAEERAWSFEDELELPEILARTIMDVEVSSSDPGAITIMLEASPYVLIEGAATPGRLVDEGDVERWTTADGWTWTLYASELYDESLVVSLREHITAWRATRAASEPE